MQGSRGAGERRSRGAGGQGSGGAGERGSGGAGEQGRRGAGEQGRRGAGEQGRRGAGEQGGRGGRGEAAVGFCCLGNEGYHGWTGAAGSVMLDGGWCVGRRGQGFRRDRAARRREFLVGFSSCIKGIVMFSLCW